jgi:hypothetical protein
MGVMMGAIVGAVMVTSRRYTSIDESLRSRLRQMGLGRNLCVFHAQ